MESSQKPLRFILPLLKARITNVTQLIDGSSKQRVKMEIGGSTTVTFDVTDLADVRVGDLCTLYTEVPMKEAN